AADDFAHRPRQAIVFGNGDALIIAAVMIRHIDRAVGRNLNVPVDAAALGRVERHGRAVGQPAIWTQRAEGRVELLRAIIDGVRVGVCAARQRRGKGATTYRLVIDARGHATTFVRRPRRAVVVRIGREAGRARKLRDDGAT